MTRGQDNTTAAAPISNFRGNVWSAFDRLPVTLRHALHESLVEWDPRETRWQLNKLIKSGLSENKASTVVARWIARSDEIEIVKFSHCWPSRHGAYPHLAANASILRYDARRRRAP